MNIKCFKVDLREPYMGNTLVIGVKIVTKRISENIVGVKAIICTTADPDMVQDMHPMPEEEFIKLFNH